MKKIILLFVFSVMSTIYSKGQIKRCFTDEYTKEEMQKDPHYAINRESLEKFTEQFSRSQEMQKTKRGTHALPYIIPVVFHVLHNYGPENVSDIEIIEALRQMNLNFRKLNEDTSDIIPPFKQIASDCEIEFRLANIDPNGNCTNGIEHIVTQKTYLANNNSKISGWPSNKYVNIWLANSLENSGAAAYAQFPGGDRSVDGIMCLYYAVDNPRRTLTHEMGHCLNLQHIWGNGSQGSDCGNDLVDDTPITPGYSAGTCLLNVSTCNPPVLENTQNYMDYSDCRNMYTAGQKVRMHACLNSFISGRNNLWQDSNLVATGTNGSIANVCIPKPDFQTSRSFACFNDVVQFTDASWNANVTNWNWSFPGGNPSTSILQNPSVTYSTSGVYSAKLVVSNASGSDSITKNAVVRVTTVPLNTIPYVESFEDSASFPGNDGWIENLTGGATWGRVTNAGSTGSSSIKMSNYINSTGAVDSWISPSFDFSNVGAPVTISFKVANAQRNSTSNDELALFYSTNCSQTWVPTSYVKSGAQLATSGVVSSNFTPNNPSQWREESLIVNAVKLKPNVRFKFQNTCDHGNNVFIDDINITGLIDGINDLGEMQSEITLYPNPTSGIAVINFSLLKSSTTRIEVKDILGKIIVLIPTEAIEAGIHEYKLPVLPSGIYMVNLIINNKNHILKLVVS